MKRFLICTLFLFTVFFIFSCENDASNLDSKRIEKIILEPCEEAFHKVILKEIVVLESNDSSIFGDHFRFFFNENNIFIQDYLFTNNLYKFDHSGNYIKKLVKGKGPNEVISVYSVFYEADEQLFYIFDPGDHAVKILDVDLNMIDRYKVDPNIALHNFSKIPSGDWMIKADYFIPNRDSSFQYVVMDSSFNKIKGKLFSLEPDFYQFGLLNPIAVNQNRSSSVSNLFCSVFDNNLYSMLPNNAYQVEFMVDFGKYNLKPDDLDNLSTIPLLWESRNRKTNIDNLIIDSDFLVFSYLFGDNYEFVIYNVRTKEIFQSECIYNLPKGRIVGIESNHFILSVDAKDYIGFVEQYSDISEKYHFNNGDDKIAEHNNPIFIKFSLD